MQLHGNLHGGDGHVLVLIGEFIVLRLAGEEGQFRSQRIRPRIFEPHHGHPQFAARQSKGGLGTQFAFCFVGDRRDRAGRHILTIRTIRQQRIAVVFTGISAQVKSQLKRRDLQRAEAFPYGIVARADTAPVDPVGADRRSDVGKGSRSSDSDLVLVGVSQPGDGSRSGQRFPVIDLFRRARRNGQLRRGDGQCAFHDGNVPAVCRDVSPIFKDLVCGDDVVSRARIGPAAGNCSLHGHSFRKTCCREGRFRQCCAVIDFAVRIRFQRDLIVDGRPCQYFQRTEFLLDRVVGRIRAAPVYRIRIRALTDPGPASDSLDGGFFALYQTGKRSFVLCQRLTIIGFDCRPGGNRKDSRFYRQPALHGGNVCTVRGDIRFSAEDPVCGDAIVPGACTGPAAADGSLNRQSRRQAGNGEGRFRQRRAIIDLACRGCCQRDLIADDDRRRSQHGQRAQILLENIVVGADAAPVDLVCVGARADLGLAAGGLNGDGGDNIHGSKPGLAVFQRPVGIAGDSRINMDSYIDAVPYQAVRLIRFYLQTVVLFKEGVLLRQLADARRKRLRIPACVRAGLGKQFGIVGVEVQHIVRNLILRYVLHPKINGAVTGQKNTHLLAGI